MSETADKKHLFDDPKNVSRLLNGFYVVCVILFVLDFILHRHTYLDWEKIPGFYALYGFGACVLLVLRNRSVAIQCSWRAVVRVRVWVVHMDGNGVPS